MVFDAKTVSMLVKETWRTLYMVGLSSLISYLIGIPLGVALVVTDKDGIRPVPLFNKVAGVIVNLLRSVPFIILLAMMLQSCPWSKCVKLMRLSMPMTCNIQSKGMITTTSSLPQGQLGNQKGCKFRTITCSALPTG